MSTNKFDITDRLKSAVEAKFGKRGQAKFASAIETSSSTVWEYMKGRIPPANFIARSCKILAVSSDWLLTGEEPELVKISAKEQKLLAAIRKAAPHHREAIRALLKLKDEE